MMVWRATLVLLAFFLGAESGVLRQKAGQCPPQIVLKPGYCDKDGSICTTDDHCQEGFKCCSNGCHNECLEPIYAEAGVLIVHATYHYNENVQEESAYTGSCNSTKDCPRYSRCIVDKCECMFGVYEYDKHGHIQKCRASFLFGEHDDTTSLLVALGISLGIFFGYFIIGSCFLCSIKRLRRPCGSSGELSSPLTKNGNVPEETSPLHSGQNDFPAKKESSVKPSTSNIYPQLEKKGLNDNIKV